jgi:hypothetical protein
MGNDPTPGGEINAGKNFSYHSGFFADHHGGELVMQYDDLQGLLSRAIAGHSATAVQRQETSTRKCE